MAQSPVCTPFLGQFNRGPVEVALELLQFGFQPGKERKSVGCGTGEPYEHGIVEYTPDFFGAFFQNGIAESNLAVSGYYGAAAPLDQKNRGSMKNVIVCTHKRAV